MPLFSMQGAKETAELLAAHDESTAKKKYRVGLPFVKTKNSHWRSE
jgi:hypothetical protein